MALASRHRSVISAPGQPVGAGQRCKNGAHSTARGGGRPGSEPRPSLFWPAGGGAGTERERERNDKEKGTGMETDRGNR